MKRCQKCSHENADSMRFCLECGTPLPDAPIIINWQDSGTQKQSEAKTDSFGQSMETHVGGRSAFPDTFPTTPPTPPRSRKKIFIIIGGLAALFLLVFAAGAAIIGYNLLYPPPKPVVYNPTPTASPTRSTEKSPTASPSKSPTPTDSPTPEDSPEEPPKSDSDKADFDRIWVDYNVTEKGRPGMRIHVDCTVKNMKGVSSYLALYFQKKDGEKLVTNSQGFRSENGHVALFKSLKPAYDPAVYEDSQFFMPYDELNLKRGKYDLQIDVDLIYENGEMAQHMTLYDFEYEKK